MEKHIEAIYENGAFRPVSSEGLDFREGDHVRLTVGCTGLRKTSDILDFAGQVYAGLSESDVTEIELIAMDRTSFFPSEES